MSDKEQNEKLKLWANRDLLEHIEDYLIDVLGDTYNVQNVEMFTNLEGNKVIKYSHYDSTYLISIEELQKTTSVDDYTLEDWVNILARNEPNKRKHIQEWNEWLSILTDAEEELFIEDERPLECERIIKEIKKFVGWE